MGVVGVAGGDFLFLRSLWWFSSAASALFFFFDLSAADAVALDDFGVKIWAVDDDALDEFVTKIFDVPSSPSVAMVTSKSCITGEPAASEVEVRSEHVDSESEEDMVAGWENALQVWPNISDQITM